MVRCGKHLSNVEFPSKSMANDLQQLPNELHKWMILDLQVEFDVFI